MRIHEDLDRAERAVHCLESAVLSLREQLGPHLDLLRLADDVARCAADLKRLSDHTPGHRRRVADHDLVVIPDGEYDPSLWPADDVDIEGLGAPGRRAP